MSEDKPFTLQRAAGATVYHANNFPNGREAVLNLLQSFGVDKVTNLRLINLYEYTLAVEEQTRRAQAELDKLNTKPWPAALPVPKFAIGDEVVTRCGDRRKVTGYEIRYNLDNSVATAVQRDVFAAEFSRKEKDLFPCAVPAPPVPTPIPTPIPAPPVVDAFNIGSAVDDVRRARGGELGASFTADGKALLSALNTFGLTITYRPRRPTC